MFRVSLPTVVKDSRKRSPIERSTYVGIIGLSLYPRGYCSPGTQHGGRWSVERIAGTYVVLPSNRRNS